MRIIAKRTLRLFWEENPHYRDAKQALEDWYAQVSRADWATPAEVKADYGDASILKASRVVFNICGNKYRLVVHINYPYRVVYVRFIGPHKQYDAIDAESICKDITPIRNEADYEATLAEIERLMDAKPGTRGGDRLDILVTLVEAYEDKYWQIDPPDPIEAIKVRMEQRGLTRQDLAQVLGSKSRVSEVLSRKRPLTLAMIQRLHKDWGIPAESLIRPTTRSPKRKRPATQTA